MSSAQEAFTKRFCDWRDAQGTTRRALAQHLGVTEQTLINWERGTQPTIEPLTRLADYSGLSLDWWLGLTDERARVRRTRRKAE